MSAPQVVGEACTCPMITQQQAAAYERPWDSPGKNECWSGLPFSSSEYLPDPGIEPVSLASAALESGFFTAKPPGKPLQNVR